MVLVPTERAKVGMLRTSAVVSPVPSATLAALVVKEIAPVGMFERATLTPLTRTTAPPCRALVRPGGEVLPRGSVAQHRRRASSTRSAAGVHRSGSAGVRAGVPAVVERGVVHELDPV